MNMEFYQCAVEEACLANVTAAMMSGEYTVEANEGEEVDNNTTTTDNSTDTSTSVEEESVDDSTVTQRQRQRRRLGQKISVEEEERM